MGEEPSAFLDEEPSAFLGEEPSAFLGKKDKEPSACRAACLGFFFRPTVAALEDFRVDPAFVVERRLAFPDTVWRAFEGRL